MTRTLDDAELATALGPHDFRLEGVIAARVAALGHANVARLLTLCAEAANHYLTTPDESHPELRVCQEVRLQLESLAARGLPYRPVLPRLRAELFRPGDAVVVYVRDTFPDAPFDWIAGRVERVDKSQKPEFTLDRATRGFYWRVSVTPTPHVVGLADTLPCSTTEPRVVLADDFRQLTASFEADLPFLAMYCANAARDWAPIWAMERGRTEPTSSAPFASWLLKGSRHPAVDGG